MSTTTEKFLSGKRYKKVFPSSEVYHEWAHFTHEEYMGKREVKNSSWNKRGHGRKLYSYNMEIAWVLKTPQMSDDMNTWNLQNIGLRPSEQGKRFLEHVIGDYDPNKGIIAIIDREDFFSSTTARHTTQAYSSLDYTRFHVVHLCNNFRNHSNCFYTDNTLYALEECLDKQTRARKTDYSNRINSLANTLALTALLKYGELCEPVTGNIYNNKVYFNRDGNTIIHFPLLEEIPAFDQFLVASGNGEHEEFRKKIEKISREKEVAILKDKQDKLSKLRHVLPIGEKGISAILFARDDNKEYWDMFTTVHDSVSHFAVADPHNPEIFSTFTPNKYRSIPKNLSAVVGLEKLVAKEHPKEAMYDISDRHLMDYLILHKDKVTIGCHKMDKYVVGMFLVDIPRKVLEEKGFDIKAVDKITSKYNLITLLDSLETKIKKELNSYK